MSKYVDALESPDPFPETPDFVFNEVIPRLAKQLEDAGNGWITEMDEIHSREVLALITYAEHYRRLFDELRQYSTRPGHVVGGAPGWSND